jgi:uncharacterized protein YjbI with pentapeptide repeats
MNISYKDNEDITRIITDEPTNEAPDFREYSRKLSKIIINSVSPFTVGIFGDWGTGKTTLMNMIKDEIDDKYSDIATTIWFDSWRYEREKYSAMIPLLRTIILSLENKIKNSEHNEKKREILQRLKHKFNKIGEEIIRNTNLNVGFNLFNQVNAGATFDIGKALDNYKSDGSLQWNQERIYFHKHISDHLKEELEKIRKDSSKFRIIIFIDDLDRCTPERALEILESIKTFFDIEGIIYVIGMDPLTIDPIIKTKYEKNPKIDGMHYLEKIVQLPFTIPLWSAQDLFNVIEKLVKKARLSESYLEEIRNNQELIIKATKLNPRDIKRFINSIVLAKDIYEQNVQNIDKIIAIQAFYFHGYRWMDFLKLLTTYEERVKFLTHFILLLEKNGNLTSLEDLAKIILDDNNKEKKDYNLYNSLIDSLRDDKFLNNIYEKLIKIDDNDLFTFLKIAAAPLLKIDKIENYLRIVDTTGLTIKRENIKIIDSQKSLKLLQNEQIEEFNKYREDNKIIIHLPYADLQKLKLINRVNLSYSFLFKANLREANLAGADLTKADLAGADLAGADLTKAYLARANLVGTLLKGANLSGANLGVTNLSGVNLAGADLTNANLREANLAGADLAGADLAGADLKGADLTKAYMPRVDLTKADLREANLAGANLREANLREANLGVTNLSGVNLAVADLIDTNLSGANLTDGIIINNTFSEKTIVLNANFEKAIIDNHEFFEYLHKNQGKNIPTEKIKNKQQLRLELESKKIDKSRISYLLKVTKVPSI